VDHDQNTTEPKKTRTQYSQSYKYDALASAERVGFSKAATQLGILESQLYYRKNKLRQQQTSSEREQLLADENARLKRLLAEQAEELAIVKRPQRTLPRTRSEKFSSRQQEQQRLDEHVTDAFQIEKRPQWCASTRAPISQVSILTVKQWLQA